ncbi:protein adenylyltransferase Fic [Condylostylus longicornis]|uniref:protein adenylyltransferase Fic n=1 Tax=Condylostylus longicornis TaxID=2530218 RepID=UPI00244E47A2|nr:protein adenylyltransferase Fic [Condylostylus longicornis]
MPNLLKMLLDHTIIKISLNSIIIFITGVFFSSVIFLFIHNKYFRYSQISFHVPDETNLQVRDDFSVYSPFIPRNEQNDIIELNANIQEAISTLRLAIEMKSAGKPDKACRLFKHAVALAPKHPEILVNYGEFLEQYHKDIVQADQLYYQALMINPRDTQAIENRRRTASIVDVIDENTLKELDKKRDALSGIEESNSALRRAKKEAYFQHIYHSVGIEGNTMTLAQTRSIIETRMAVDGKSIDEHNEIIGLDAAMKYINATLVNKQGYITLKDILEIHRRVLGHVDPIEGGEFRRNQVYVGGHVPPGPDDLAVLMNSFERWLNSENSFTMHPVKYAALAHYKLVHIHPFIDGNGRTSRLLMNTILMRAGYPPIIIPKQLRHRYYNYLQLANEGDIRPFIRFIAECTGRTLDLYLWSTSNLAQPIPLLEEHIKIKNKSELIFTEEVIEDIIGGEEEFKSESSLSRS